MNMDRLITDLFPKEERGIARAIHSECLAGLSEDKQIAALHELAQSTEMQGEQCARYFASFLENIGAGVGGERFTRWVDAGGPGAFPEADASASETPAGDEPAVVNPPAPAGPTRQQLQAQIAQHERDMRADPGSEAWKRYWRKGGSADCLDVRRALENTPMSPAAQ
jgi:hypothetical protein